MSSTKGFTTTEIIIILVVIGILAGIAIPKYFSVRDRYMLNTAGNFANGMATASAINYTECKAGNLANCKKTTSCSDFATLIINKLPSDMQVRLKPGTPFPAEPGMFVECQVLYGSKPIEFKAIANP